MIQHAMTRRGAFLGLGYRAVIEPGDRVPTALATERDGNLPIIRIARDQRAGRVEGDAAYVFGFGT